MIIFIYGPDTYRSRQKLNEIVEHYKKIHKSGLNLKYFDFKKDSFEDFRDSFRSSSMFKEKKLLVLQNIFANLKIENDFSKFLMEFSKSKEIVLIYEKEVDENNPFFKKLKKITKSQNYKLLKESQLRDWVKKEFQKYSNKIDAQALELLVNYVGNNLWQMENEIKKLVNYCGKNEIKTQDVETLVRPKIETDIFKTIDAIAAKNKKEALTLIKEHLEKGDSPAYLLAMINFQFRNLVIVGSQSTNDTRMFRIKDMSKKLRMHPFVLRKTIQQARKFSLEELKKIYQKIFEVDLDIKTGKLDPETALDLLITKM